MKSLSVVPLTLKQANELVGRLHRHHAPVVGHRFSVGATLDRALVGAAVVGRPTARNVHQYEVAEVTRLVTDGTRNACSLLYSSCARAAKAMGYALIQTYILESEPGTSLLASGWRPDGHSNGGSWSRRGRVRIDHHPLGAKQKWVRYLNRPDPIRSAPELPDRNDPFAEIWLEAMCPAQSQQERQAA